MTQQHTQWTYEAHIPHGSGDAEWRVIDAQGNVVAIVDPNMLCDNETTCAEPQARLIASAPELLAAAKALLNGGSWHDDGSFVYYPPDDPESEGAVGDLGATIAKAEGTA